MAELEERIEALTRMRDTLVRRMPWLGERGPGESFGGDG